MRKWRRLLIGLVVLVALAGAVIFLLPALERPGPSLRTFARISTGMTEAEVASVLGPPDTDVTDAPPAGVPAAALGGRLKVYTGERATATVEFGPDGRMVRIHVVIWAVNLEERIRGRLNWWW